MRTAASAADWFLSARANQGEGWSTNGPMSTWNMSSVSGKYRPVAAKQADGQTVKHTDNVPTVLPISAKSTRDFMSQKMSAIKPSTFFSMTRMDFTVKLVNKTTGEQ